MALLSLYRRRGQDARAYGMTIIIAFIFAFVHSITFVPAQIDIGRETPCVLFRPGLCPRFKELRNLDRACKQPLQKLPQQKFGLGHCGRSRDGQPIEFLATLQQALR